MTEQTLPQQAVEHIEETTGGWGYFILGLAFVIVISTLFSVLIYRQGFLTAQVSCYRGEIK